MVYFISDMHLGAKYLPDPKQAERRIVSFLESIADDATDLYILGDAIDFWYEYREVVPKGYVRFFGALARLADKGVKIHWFTGNHDIWMRDYVEKELGAEVVKECHVEEIQGKKFFLSHGDDVGRRPLGYRIMRAIFHNKVCQTLFSMLHPWFAMKLGRGWSSKSRGYDSYDPKKYDNDQCIPLVNFAKEYLEKIDSTIDYFIFGHYHMVVDEKLSQNCELLVIGEWIHINSYAKFDGKSVKIEYYKEEC